MAFTDVSPTSVPASGARLSVSAWREGAVYFVRPAGELGETGAPSFNRVLAKAESSGAERIILDLSRLSRIDAEGLRSLLAARRRARQNGHRLLLTRGRGHVAEMLRLSALDRPMALIEPARDRCAERLDG